MITSDACAVVDAVHQRVAPRSRRRPPCGARRCARRPAWRWAAPGTCPCRWPRGRPSCTPSDFSTLANLDTSDQQLLVGERADFARLAFPDDGGLVLAPGRDVAVQAVVGDVDLAADEPLGARQLPFEHLVPRLEPVQLAGDLAPRIPPGRPWLPYIGARNRPGS